MVLKTRYDVGAIPHSEYPRPQLERDSFLSLNGYWDLKLKKGEDLIAVGNILVPFSPETLNSTIPNGFVLDKKDILVYTREFEIDESYMRGATVLHFGAVDYKCTVYINGKKVDITVNAESWTVCSDGKLINSGITDKKRIVINL